MITRGVTVPPLSSGGPSLVRSVTIVDNDSYHRDPVEGTVIGAPIDAAGFTVIRMTFASAGAGVDTGFGGLLFLMYKV